MRLPRSARGILGLMIIPGLLLRCVREDRDDLVEAEGVSFDFVDDAHFDLEPVALVQLAWNLTKTGPVDEPRLPLLGRAPPVWQGASEAKTWRSASAALVEALAQRRGLQGLGRERVDAVSAALIIGSAVVILALTAGICFANLERHKAEGSGEPEEVRRGTSSEAAAAAAALLPPPRAFALCSSTVPIFSSEESQASKDQHPENDVDLNEDIYSTVLQGILCDGVAILWGAPRPNHTMAIHRFRMISVLVLLSANYLLQFGILYFIVAYVVTPEIAKVQGIYRDFRKACFFPSGELNPGVCNQFRGIQDLCGLVFTYTWFMFLILMLWTMTMVREFRDTERLSRILWNIETTTHLENMIEYSGGAEHVTHLTPAFRFMIFLLVTLPKISISALLGILGTVWLSSTSELSELILNAVALEFIIKIDELVFEAVVPVTARQDLSKFKLTLREKVKPGVMNSDVWRAYVSSLLYLLVIVGVPPLYLTVGQQVPFINVFPGYDRGEVEQVCVPYLDVHKQRACLFGTGVCFPYGR